MGTFGVRVKRIKTPSKSTTVERTLIITDDVLIDWLGLTKKFKEFYKLDDKSSKELIDCVVDVVEGKKDEEEGERCFKSRIRRSFKEEIALHINRNIVDVLERWKGWGEIILITNLNSYSYIYLPILHLFSRIFVPEQYKKVIDDEGFINVVYGYVKYYSLTTPHITLFSHNYSFIKKFVEKVEQKGGKVRRVLYYDLYNKYKGIKLPIGDAVSLQYISGMNYKNRDNFLSLLKGE